MMFMGLAAINSQANLLFGVFGLMIGILLVSGLVSRFGAANASCSARLRRDAVVGTAGDHHVRAAQRKDVTGRAFR